MSQASNDTTVITQQPKANPEQSPSAAPVKVVPSQHLSKPPSQQPMSPQLGHGGTAVEPVGIPKVGMMDGGTLMDGGGTGGFGFVGGLPALPMAPVPGCPIGLEFLLGTEHLFIKQQIEMVEAISAQLGLGIETPNRYDILNSQGQRIYYASETGSCFAMQCSPSGKTRPFDITVVDFVGRKILTIDRPWSCGFCILSCCNFCGTAGTQIKITLGDGSMLGTIIQPYNGCQPLLHVFDNSWNLVANIEGPTHGDCCLSCPGSCGSNVIFKVRLPDGTVVGEVTKHWSGFFVEALTDADLFGISFPLDMDVLVKALLLGGVFLIDFMFFEKKA